MAQSPNSTITQLFKNQCRKVKVACTRIIDFLLVGVCNVDTVHQETNSS